MTVEEIALFQKARKTFEEAAKTGRHPDMLHQGPMRYLDLLGNIYRAADVAIPWGEKAYAPERMKKVYEWCAGCCINALTDELLAEALLPNKRLVRDLGGPNAH